MTGVADMQDRAVARPAGPAGDRRLRELVDYWAGKRGPAGDAPRRHDLDPAEMRPLLPWLMLLDVLEDDYRYRLVGTGLDGLFGRPLTGLTLRAAWPARLGDHWRHWMDHASRTATPVATSATLHGPRGPLRLDAVFLPLCNRPGRVDMLLSGISGTCLRRATPMLLLRPGVEVLEDAVTGFTAETLTV
ncbi:PAS domain-containing protein [Niveispirillum fermenti]|uniref:PAS domain-containing protein n=1 Tax=Niveispirillum fermenti TaxID=1233113 RepID=UPI003A8BEBB8